MYYIYFWFCAALSAQFGLLIYNSDLVIFVSMAPAQSAKHMQTLVTAQN